MSSFQIKVLACLFMLVDHTGVILFPEQIVLRIIGRLAFPLFAWAIANGAAHTRSLPRYFRRLFLFGMILQLPYGWYFRDWTLNIFFTLSLGLLAIWLYRCLEGRGLDPAARLNRGFLATAGIGLAAELVRADYGLYGILTIFLFYACRDDFRRLLYALGLLNLGRFLGPWLAMQLGQGSLSYMDWIQPLSLVSLLFVYYYNGKKGRSWKYLFYIFYPAHLLILYGIKLLLK